MTKKNWHFVFLIACTLSLVYGYIAIRAEEKGLLNSNDIFYSKILVLVFGIVIFLSYLASSENEEQRYGRLVGILAMVIIAISKYLW